MNNSGLVTTPGQLVKHIVEYGGIGENRKKNSRSLEIKSKKILKTTGKWVFKSMDKNTFNYHCAYRENEMNSNQYDTFTFRHQTGACKIISHTNNVLSFPKIKYRKRRR